MFSSMSYVGLRVNEKTKKKWEEMAKAEGKTLTEIIKEGIEEYGILKKVDKILGEYVADGLFDNVSEARSYVLIECIAEGHIREVLEKYKRELNNKF